MAGGWATPPAADECVVWWAARRSWPTLVAALDEIEQARLAALRRPDDRDRFATGVWLLRSVAAAALGTDPTAVAVDRRCPQCGRQHGRPRVHLAGGEELRTSVTHAGDVVGLAVSLVGHPIAGSADGSDGCGLGLDVESPDARTRLARLASEVLAPAEQAALADEECRSTALVRRWVTKEAALKAAGVGLRVDPRAVELHDDGHALRLQCWPIGVPPALVHAIDLDPPAPGHVASLVVVAVAAPIVRQRRAPDP